MRIKVENLVTVKQYADLQGVTIQTVYNWLKEGKIKEVEFMSRKWIDKSTYKA